MHSVRKWFKNRNYRILNHAGASMVEVTVAGAILITILVFGSEFFFLSQKIVIYEKFRRLAVVEARQRLEEVKSLPYESISEDLNETDHPVSLSTRSGKRSTTILLVDDAADGLGADDIDMNIVDYKTITVSITYMAGREKTIVLTTTIADVAYAGGTVLTPSRSTIHSRSLVCSHRTITKDWLKLI